MTPSQANPMTRAEKLEMYLSLPEKDTRRVNERVDYAGIETALAEAGRMSRESASAGKPKVSWRFRRPSRKVILIAAAVAILLILAIACICTGLFSRALNFKKKSALNSITLPSNAPRKSKPETPAVEPKEEANKIVFLSARDKDANETRHFQAIYNMNPDGSEQTPLTEVGSNYTPSISPDESQIAYSHNGAIWIMHIDGGGKRELVHGEPDDGGYGGYYYPIWSPDGTKLAFIWEEKDPRLYVFDIISGELFSNIGPSEGVFAIGWLSDNRTIIFESGHDAIETVEYDGQNAQKIFSDSDFRYRDLVVAPQGDGFVFSRASRDAKGKDNTIVAGSYPGFAARDIAVTPYAWPARLTNAGIAIINYGQDGFIGQLDAIDTRSGKQWTLCQYNDASGEVTSTYADHSGDAFYLENQRHDKSSSTGIITQSSFIFRVDMDGTVTRITDSGADSRPTWR